MGIGRKEVEKRLPLYRKCGTCGKGISTQANTPWARIIKSEDGKRHNTYYCSETCKQASYKGRIRICGTCGRTTSTSSEWLRDMPNKQGKRHYTYFCSKACMDKSYKHQNQISKDRDYFKNYYIKNADRLKARRRERYWKNPEAAREANRHNYEKRKLKGHTAWKKRRG